MNVNSIAGVAAAVIACGGFIIVPHVLRRSEAQHRVDFSRDIRPILNQSCASCHGGVRQKNGVSFIYREEALGKGTSGRPTVVPGHPERSELMARLVTSDPEARMPYHAPPLPGEQIALLRQWIKEGAQWEDHWSFVPPKPQSPPEVRNLQWPRYPLDRFVLARLQKEGLGPSPEAAKPALLRRVSFDLTGLPPTPDELSAFIADTAPDAYEKQVDRLLASPHFGERWATVWLDLARYADSRGFEQDADRPMWPYRDWLIEAFNRGVPYDRFVITQLAGDLLPEATLDDQIATAFHRMTPVNDEGGTDDEEFRLQAVMDRVATTWSVLNGLTINCVQCHSHPYDPIRHVEYYNFLGFYNTSRDSDLSDDSPTIPVPRDAALRAQVGGLIKQKSLLAPEIVQRGRSLASEAEWDPLPITAATVNETLAVQRLINQLKLGRAANINPRAFLGDDRVEVRASYDQAIAEAKSHLARLGAASPRPLNIDQGELRVVGGTISAQSVYELSTDAPVSPVAALRIEILPQDEAKARHTPEEGFIVNQVDVWIVSPHGEDRKVKFRYFAPDSEENLELELRTAGDLTQEDVTLPPGATSQSLSVTLGDRGAVVGVGEFTANSKLSRTRWTVAIPESPLSLEPGSHLKIQLTHLQTSGLKPAVAKRVRVSTSRDERWTKLITEPAFVRQLRDLADIQARLDRIPSIRLPVMAEQPRYDRRETREFERGNFLNKIGPGLTAGVPAIFGKLPADAPRDRLTMAKWFFSPGQPLTARVAVNRFWEQLFGTGIVETLEDFGSAGQPPSHPELLDWLALHFQKDLHWDMKALLRELVTSATYRQRANTSSSLLSKDPRNRLLSHGPQQRLTAEMVRDQALMASGLLNGVIGGAPVMPPQPGGLWMNIASSAKWVDATGPDRYRRAIYTYEKRSSPYPSFVTFDGPDHLVSLARRIPTNTPLQALITLNDPVYQEATEALAKRMVAIKGQSAAKPDERSPRNEDAQLVARLNFGAQCVLSRELNAKELAALAAFYRDIRRAPSRSEAGRYSRISRRGGPLAGRSDLAALTAVATALFNFDAALTR